MFLNGGPACCIGIHGAGSNQPTEMGRGPINWHELDGAGRAPAAARRLHSPRLTQSKPRPICIDQASLLLGGVEGLFERRSWFGNNCRLMMPETASKAERSRYKQSADKHDTHGFEFPLLVPMISG
jgi:hypothetical protein